jgi:UDP-sugar pyrophosphorylase
MQVTKIILHYVLDPEKTKFKTPTRLECMMQEFPKLFPKGSKVGFTRFERWMCFSTVKNNVIDGATKSASGIAPETASSAEADFYHMHQRLLEKCGVQFEGSPKELDFAGIKFRAGAKVILLPNSGVSLAELKQRIKGMALL